jgi:hypothetical protein
VVAEACDEPKVIAPPPAQQGVVVSAAKAAAAPPAQDGEKLSAANAACAAGVHHEGCIPVQDPPAGSAGPGVAIKGTKYGEGVTLATSVNVDELLANADKYAGQRVRIEGTVTDVCKMAGCWMQVQGTDGGKSIKFKVTDGVMVFPQSAIGKQAVAEGTVRKMPLTLDQTRRVLSHEAEEQGRRFDPDSVKEPMTLVRLDGTGAVIRE